MKVVFDTNIYISGLLFKGGIPSRLVELAREKRFSLFLSPEIIQEINEVLDKKFGLNLHERTQLLRWIQASAQIVYPELSLKIIKACEADNRILECALEAKADYLVTGDKKHLLPLIHTLPFKIISAAQFYSILMK